MLKRLSYPLSWVGDITGSDDKDSLPSSADSHPSSVFSISKVFSRSVFYLFKIILIFYFHYIEYIKLL